MHCVPQQAAGMVWYHTSTGRLVPVSVPVITFVSRKFHPHPLHTVPVSGMSTELNDGTRLTSNNGLLLISLVISTMLIHEANEEPIRQTRKHNLFISMHHDTFDLKHVPAASLQEPPTIHVYFAIDALTGNNGLTLMEESQYSS